MVALYILIFFLAISIVLYFQSRSSGWGQISILAGAIVIIVFFAFPMERKSTFKRINLDSSLVIEKSGAYYTLPAFLDRSKSSQVVESKQKPTGILIEYETSLAGIVLEKKYSVLFD